MFNLKNQQEIDNFLKICEESNSMSQAASKLNLNFKTFRRLAKELNCYCPHQNWNKGLK